MNGQLKVALEQSEPWETEDGWELVVCEAVMKYPLAPRDARAILIAAGEISRLGVDVPTLITRMINEATRNAR